VQGAQCPATLRICIDGAVLGPKAEWSEYSILLIVFGNIV